MSKPYGKRTALPVSDQLSMMEKAKERGLSVSRGQSVYKVNGKSYDEVSLQNLLTMKIDELANFATEKSISLSDVEEVKKRTFIYFKCCEESKTFPSNQGIARALGYTDRALRMWRARNLNTETGKWLEMCSEMCAEILHQSALTGNAQPIITIFLSKANYDMREENYITVNGANNNPFIERREYNENEIRERLGLPLVEDENE